MRTRQWRRLERRAVAGYERDLLAAIDEICARHCVVTAIELEPAAGRTAKIELGHRRLVLGPLAVDPKYRELGVGAALMNHALLAAGVRGHGAVILLGDAPYYARFGFSALKTGELSLPGPFERDRLLGLELCDGALDGAWGMIAPTGTSTLKTRAARARKTLASVPHAA